MEPKIETRPAFTVVGIKYRGNNENNEIPQLWGTFGPRMDEVPLKAESHVAYGVMGNLDESTGEFDYVAGFEVESVANIPEGMVSWALPEQTYAIFRCTLPIIREAFEYIFQTWLPASGYQHADGPEFELYDEEFNPEDPDSKLCIYIPIKP